MVKPLAFKGDHKTKKRKVHHVDYSEDDIGSKAFQVQASSVQDPRNDDSWVSAEGVPDLNGPVIFVLPSVRPTCLACDTNGKVFTSDLENMVDGDPQTAEPHDVRQVWIASKIAGTEEMSFKAHHQRYQMLKCACSECTLNFCRYLSCDKIGSLSATGEAISPEESFKCVPSSNSPGFFCIQTVRDRFFTIVDDSKVTTVRGDADSISFNTTLRIRMQARFKPKLRANKEQKVKERISRRELEEAVGRRLEDEEVRRLKRARLQGNYHEAVLDVRVKEKHDKYT